MNRILGTWNNGILDTRYMCGYCQTNVLSKEGLKCSTIKSENARIAICPNCNRPTFFDLTSDTKIPGNRPQDIKEISNLPEEIKIIYYEMLDSHANNCFTSVLLLGRKLLMHLACEQGAKVNLAFIDYVNYFVEENLIPKSTTKLTDKLREYGNEVNHKLHLANKEESNNIICFTNLILLNIYHYSNL